MKSIICPYFEKCNVAKISGRDCVRDYQTTCQTYKFYKRYPEHLGIGAMVDVSRLEKITQKNHNRYLGKVVSEGE